MKEKNNIIEITGEEYNNLTNNYTASIMELNKEIVKNKKEIERECKYLEELCKTGQEINGKIENIKNIISKLKKHRKKLVDKLRKYRKLIINLNDLFNLSNYEDYVEIDMNDYNLEGYEEERYKNLTPELYKTLVNSLNSKVSEAINSVDVIRHKLKEETKKLNAEEEKKKDNKKLLKESRSRLDNLTSIENAKVNSIKKITREHNKLSKQVVKTKKR